MLGVDCNIRDMRACLKAGKEHRGNRLTATMRHMSFAYYGMVLAKTKELRRK